MPMWGHVELLCRSIAEDGRKQAEKLLEQARLQAEKTIRDARQQAERQYMEARLSGGSQAAAEARRLVDTAEFEARRRVMLSHGQMLQEVLDALMERLIRFRTEPAYERFLISAVREAMKHLPGRDFIIELTESDAETIRSQIEELTHECSVAIDLHGSNRSDGGVRVFTADRKVMIDNRFAARLNRMEEDIRQEIWRMIVGTRIRQE